MDNYLEIYAHWYPRSYGLSDYPMECHVTYSGAERKALFEQLTEAQQALVNQQRNMRFARCFYKSSICRPPIGNLSR